MKWIIRFFGLPGSWSWACRQMQKGKTVKQRSSTGAVQYKLDHEGQERILWTFKRQPENQDWENANIFLSDFRSTDWFVVTGES